ncbi:tripartite tricarboxylate transporter TctB family protein [Falsiroseomonas oryzae]|uniref:tripartite tricarboxylate transporter TctB family protein n=1 Tax=Falsiroseomonas oryzae TaxID=2766473 RepID=UPI0022EA37A0|nr:tripartite tricarboxylate transporter TctB family protein [Roseomonas sp. MO-31]
MKLSDRVSGALLVVLGAAAAISGSRLPAVPGQDVGPAVFPMVVGGGLVLCGAAIALGIGHAFEAPDEEEGGPRGQWYGLRALVPPALLVFYVLVVEPLGFLPTAAIIVGVASAALGAGWRLALPLALVAPFAVHAVFAKLLRVPLPDGLLAAPW